MSASTYASMLFPKLGPRQAQQTAQLYADLGTPLVQNNLIMGDCTNVPIVLMNRSFLIERMDSDFHLPYILSFECISEKLMEGAYTNVYQVMQISHEPTATGAIRYVLQE
jgi:hypothetical protein